MPPVGGGIREESPTRWAAGVTPAPTVNREIPRTVFRSQGREEKLRRGLCLLRDALRVNFLALLGRGMKGRVKSPITARYSARDSGFCVRILYPPASHLRFIPTEAERPRLRLFLEIASPFIGRCHRHAGAGRLAAKGTRLLRWSEASNGIASTSSGFARREPLLRYAHQRQPTVQHRVERVD